MQSHRATNTGGHPLWFIALLNSGLVFSKEVWVKWVHPWAERMCVCPLLCAIELESNLGVQVSHEHQLEFPLHGGNVIAPNLKYAAARWLPGAAGVPFNCRTFSIAQVRFKFSPKLGRHSDIIIRVKHIIFLKPHWIVYGWFWSWKRWRVMLF